MVACDSVSFLELEPAHQAVHVGLEYRFDEGPAEASAGVDKGFSSSDAPAEDAFWRHYDACLGCSYPTRYGDSRSVTTMSDFYSQREFHSTGMYVDYLGPLGFEFEAMLCLPAPAELSRRLVLFRSGRTDFSARDRLLLALLRPHLAEVERERSQRRQAGAALTSRQYELLRLVARGPTSRSPGACPSLRPPFANIWRTSSSGSA